MSKEFVITLIPAFVMLGFAIFGVSIVASVVDVPSVDH